MPQDPLLSVHTAPFRGGEGETTPRGESRPERRLPPIFLFPGLAADKRLFQPVERFIPSIRTPGWLAPYRGETIESYAPRMAQVVRKDLDRLDEAHAKVPRTRLRPSDRYFIGGFSFGGQVALEMVHALFPKPAGIILLCGVRGRHQFTPAFFRQQKLSSLVPSFVQKPMYGPYAAHFAKQEQLDAAGTLLLVQMAKANDPGFLKWSTRACAHWKGTPRGIIASHHTLQPASDDPAESRYEIPIHHIHGERDRIIPDVKREATYTIPNAKHLITLTHAQLVADWLREIVLAGATW